MNKLLLLLALCLPTFAQSYCEPFPAPRNLIIVPAGAVDPEFRELEMLMHVYQHKFQMDKWKLTLHLTTHAVIDVTRPGAFAVTEWDYEAREADIYVMRLAEYTPEFWKSYGLKPQTEEWNKADQRDSVVHELIHGVIKYANEESAVTMLTGAIAP